MVDTPRRGSGKRISHWWKWQFVGGPMLGNTRISRTVTITSSWTTLYAWLSRQYGFTSSWSCDYMGRSGDGMTTSLALRTKSPNKIQNVGFSITDITYQDFRKMIKGLNYITYIGYKKKQFHNKPTKSYLFLIIHVSKQIKSKKHVQLCTKGVKLEINKIKFINNTIRHVNKAIQTVITSINGA